MGILLKYIMERELLKTASIKNLIGVLFLGFIISGCTSSQGNNKSQQKQQKSSNFYTLHRLNDFSERSFVYHQYCLKDKEPINENFLENMEFIANKLLDASVDKYGWKPEHAAQQILIRRKTIQQQLSEHYHTEGCYSLEGHESEQNYRTISKMTKKQIQ